MLNVTLKGLLAHKLRLVTTALAVLLGVAFMSGSLVLTDTIAKTFDDLFADVNAGTDAFVRSAQEVEAEFGGNARGRVEADLVDVVAGVDGAAVAEGTIQGYAQIVGADGEPLGNPAMGAPTFGGNWNEVDALNPFTLVEGRPPEADGEMVIDKASADDGDLAVGDTTTVLTQAGAPEVEVVGIARFGDSDSPGGASFALFTTEAAQDLVTQPGTFDGIAVVAEDGVSEEELRDRIADVLPEGAEVLTGEEITEENQSDIEQALGFFNTFLLFFAVIALIVGAFIIYNTFSIIVAQRSREMALLRAVGASRRQVLGSVLIESLVVGTLASVAGLVAGIALAVGLKALLNSLGVELPASGTVVNADTVVTSLLIGLVITVGSAYFPARRAARVPPVAAMRSVEVEAPAHSVRRVVIGVAITGLAIVALLVGLFGDGGVGAVGAGALGVFLGVAFLGPAIARPISRALGAPLPALRGVTGRLARENAVRNPRRTASTAAALMIGVGLVGFITITAASARASINEVIDDAFVGDFVVDSGTFGFGGLSPEVADRLNELSEVDVANGIRLTPVEVDGSATQIGGVDPERAFDLFDVGVVAGDPEDLDEDGIAVFSDVAEDKGLELGGTVPVTFPETGVQELTVALIYEHNELAGDYLIGFPAYEANVSDQFDFQVLVNLADGVSPEEGRAAIETVADDYPTAEVQDITEYKEAQAGFVDQFLNLVYALLALAILIALLGIANTLALSIFERTRELGLLRAVGMTRRQLRSAVRWEAVIIALLGTFLGLVIGLFFGWALVEALADEGFTEFAIPVMSLVVVVVVAALAGVLAAVLPARRAAKLDVLTAIHTE